MWNQIHRAVLGEYDYSTRHRALEFTATVGFALLAVVFGLRVLTAMSADGAAGLQLWWALPTMALIGYTAADFVSGLVHWMGDTFGSEQTPVLGPGFVKPFRDHHVDPRGITHHDWIEVNGNNCILLVGFLLPFYLVLPIERGGWWAFCSGVLLTFCASIFMTNQIHRWAHLERPPALVRALQTVGLVMSPEHHDIHHRCPHDTYYCITSGWMNPILHRTGFFPRLETLVRRVLRIPKP